MFQVNDTVAYGSNGVCRVAEITRQKSGKNLVQYYVLKPVSSQGSTIFVPTGNENLVGKMRQIPSADEVMSLIHSLPEMEEIWPENDSERQVHFREILQSGDRAKILQIIKSLRLHQSRRQKAGLKFRATDERMLKETENILYSEFSYVLGLPKEQITTLIYEELAAAI